MKIESNIFRPLENVLQRLSYLYRSRNMEKPSMVETLIEEYNALPLKEYEKLICIQGGKMDMGVLVTGNIAISHNSTCVVLVDNNANEYSFTYKLKGCKKEAHRVTLFLESAYSIALTYRRRDGV